MLAADKLRLQAQIRQNTVVLKEKEFTLHSDNFNIVGTQASVLAGFSVTALIEFHPPAESSRVLKFCFYFFAMVTLSANMLCIAKTTFLTVFGTSLAMRGPDGAMIRAVDGMYKLRTHVFGLFNVGTKSLLLSSIFASWIRLSTGGALLASAILIYVLYVTEAYRRQIAKMFHFDEHDAVSFEDLFEASWPLATAAAPRAAPRVNSDSDLYLHHREV